MKNKKPLPIKRGHQNWTIIHFARKDYCLFMSKQLTSEQWKHLFKIFEQNQKLCWIELSKLKRVTKDTKKWFRKKYKKFICHNQDMNTLISMTGKASKKGKGVGRPKKIEPSMKFERN